MTIMPWSQQALPMNGHLAHMESSPVYVDVRSQQLASLSDHLIHLKPSSMPASMDAQQVSSHPEEGLLESFAVMPGYMMPQQLSPSYGETLEQKPFPRVQEPMDSQHMSARSKQTSHMEPWPKVITLSSTQKGVTQTKSQNPISGSVRLQKSSSKNKRVTHTEPPPKVTNESFESIRSKMRESLAAALALVCNEKIKSKVEGENSSVATPSTPEVDKTTECGELSSVTMITPAPCHDLECSSKTYEGLDVQKHDKAVGSSTVSSTDENATDNTKILKCHKMHVIEEEKPLIGVSFGENVVVQDELLMQNGLSWSSFVDLEECKVDENHGAKRLKLADDLVEEHYSESPQNLATKIEAELFKLFGGVNKKYKEKGRSLLFNLRDQHNPELRKRVVSGEIAPERLCSMTAEELASKELSEWRIAKAEELAQMVVLPDSEVDLRRLVKKTHKGEIQVEVERDDNISMEVEVGTNSLPQSRTGKRKGNLEPQLTSRGTVGKKHSKSRETGSEVMLVLPEKTDSGEDTLTSLLHDSTDYMQDVMVGEFRDAESLPPVPTLDEFMRELDSQPPFGNLSVEAIQETAISDESKSDSFEINLDTKTDSPQSKLDAAAITMETKSIHLQDSSESRPVNAYANMLTKADSAAITMNPSYKDTNLTETRVNSEHCTTPINKTLSKDKHVWDGLIQLNISSLVTVLGFYMSGERTSVNDWPSFLEIKGRVRLDAFEKFLQELSLTRSRGIMVLQFVWKQGSPDSGRVKLCETVDSYVTDGRVGFAEPVSGVELYFCPPHPKTSQVLVENLPKEHSDILMSIVDGLIGIVVWRRPTTTSALSKSLHSNQIHGSKEQHFPRKSLNSNANCTSITSFPPTVDEEPIGDDDVPPGFGPAASRADDDLPEFDFVQSKSQGPVTHFSSSKALGSGFAPPSVQSPPAGSVEHIRLMIQKYGQDESTNDSEMGIEPWNDDDNDIPEWQPNQVNQFQPQQDPQQALYQHNISSRQQHVWHPMHPPVGTFPCPDPKSGYWQRPVHGPRRYDGPLRQQYHGPRGFAYDRNRRQG